MRCPRCKTGLMVPDSSYDVPALHCLNCGDLFLEERPVVMPEIPPAVAPLSTDPRAVKSREYRRERVATGWRPEDKRPRVTKEAVNA